MSEKTVEITDANFEELVTNAKTPVILDFWAEWCGPCRMVGPVMEELAKDYGEKVVIGKLNVDHNSETSMKFKVRNIPTVLFFQNGEMVDKLVGAVPKAKYEEKLKPLLA